MAIILPNTEKNINTLAQKLIEGDVIAFPTDTVYGLAASSFDEKALLKLYDYKQRPKNNPLSLHLYNFKQVEEHLVVNDAFYILAEKFIPGAITLILNKKRNSKIHPLCSDGNNKQAFRIPNNETCLKLLSMVSEPVVATSANLSLQISPTKAEHVFKNFEDKDLLILNDNKTLLGLESTILDISEENNIKLLRYGSLTLDQLQQIGVKINIEIAENAQKSYNFKTKIQLNSTNVVENEGLLAFGKISFKIPQKTIVFNLSEIANLEEASQNLFAMLIKLDEMNLKKINIMPIPWDGIGIIINQRLLKLL